MGTQGSEQDVPNVDAVKQHLALGDVVQARHQVREGGLAGACAPDDPHRLSRLDSEVEVAEDPLIRFRVPEPDIAQLDAAAGMIHRPCAAAIGDVGP